MRKLLKNILHMLVGGIVSIYGIEIEKIIMKNSEDRTLETYSQNNQDYDIY